MFTPRSLSLVAAFCATLVACSAQALTPCADKDNIIANAASDTANRAAGGQGGHVGLHMRDARSPLPKSGDQSQLGKSAFANWATFKGAFDTWRGAAGTHAECGTSGGKRDIADAATVGVTSGWTCTAVGKNNICTEWTEFTPVKVCFWYANSSGAKGTAGKWLLNTAYPSLNADCS
ncbi:hypothetical protein NG825_15855 [Xanthomonas sacchari]|nr:hypothetical protein NG825_15855 [Xanthomonas sacchari]